MPSLTHIRPEDLADLDDTDFRRVVEADIRRSDAKAPELHEGVSEALRTNVPRRWLTTLTQMISDIDSQLAARSDDYERSVAEHNKSILAAEDEIRRHPDDNRRHQELLRLRLEAEDAKVQHLRQRAGTLRFRNHVNHALLEARNHYDQLVDSMYQSTVVRERDFHAQRADRLANAIIRHREMVLIDLDGSEPDEIDELLWSQAELGIS